MFDVEQIVDPSFIKKLNIDELNFLAKDVRDFLIMHLSRTGGHLASNLGVVELTIAMHYVFDSPRDRFLFDVGHQAYVHKILTGRASKFATLRQIDGLSGYVSREESIHDIWESGHSSTTLSAQAGMLEVNTSNRVVALIGDSSISNGIAFEGLNYLGAHQEKAPIIILNDNKMGISKSVGALALELNRLRGKKVNRDLRLSLIKHLPLRINRITHKISKIFRSKNIFDNLGFDYYGPYEGTDIAGLIKVLSQVKLNNRPTVVHVITRKGEGYLPAMQNMTDYHGIEGFDIKTGKIKRDDNLVSFSEIIADELVNLRQQEKFKIINPAMIAGSHLKKFNELYPNDCYDVGIAEEHAICMAAGMAIEKQKVFVALYSTFAQRAYDQILNDVCRTNLNVKFIFDRAGIVGPDGATHQGIYDLAMLNMMPNMHICMPKDAAEARGLLEFVLSHNGPITMRYPKLKIDNQNKIAISNYDWQIVKEGSKGVIITYGPDVSRVIDLNLDAKVINARFIRPIDTRMLDSLILENRPILVYEQVVNSGSLGQMIGQYLASKGFEMQKYHTLNIDVDTIIHHGNIDDVLEKYHLDDKNISEEFRLLCD